MDWEMYRKKYYLFLTNLEASWFLTYIGTSLLSDFPKNLPLELKKTIEQPHSEVMSQLNKLCEKKKKNKLDELDIRFKIPELLFHFYQLQSAMPVASIKFQWDHFIRSQQLVMIFSYFDAFFSDSVRVICELYPDILRRNKHISWKDALDQQNNLYEHLVEAYVHDLGWMNSLERFKVLQKEVALKFDIPKSDLEQIRYAELIRNLIVHTGGRVTPEFLRRAGLDAKGLEIGDFITINYDFIEDISSTTIAVVGDLFKSVSTKFFGISKKKLAEFVWSLDKWSLDKWSRVKKLNYS